jgi:NADH-quinone oxidoreductase subunit N
VYQGAATPAVALLAFVPKVAGFVALVRLLGFLWVGNVAPGLALSAHVPILLWILAVMTMTLGNLLALLQDNLKRLLAYSSVAHAGYMLVGLAVTPDLGLASADAMGSGLPAVWFYLIAYGAMTVGAFAVLAYLDSPERPVEVVDDLAGLSRRRPGLALCLALFLFSLIGIPLTAGFAGKLLLFLGALSVSEIVSSEHAVWFRRLALIMALNAAVGAWYYLRVLAVMYLRDGLPGPEPKRPESRWPVLAAIAVCAALTLGLGVYPAWLVNYTTRAARPIEAARASLPLTDRAARADLP